MGALAAACCWVNVAISSAVDMGAAGFAFGSLGGITLELLAEGAAVVGRDAADDNCDLLAEVREERERGAGLGRGLATLGSVDGEVVTVRIRARGEGLGAERF